MNKSKQLLIYFIALVVVLGLSLAFNNSDAAWTAPASNPPDGNVGNIIDLSSSNQQKTGQLLLSNSGTGLVVEGRVGIGTINPQAKLDINGSIKIGDGGTCDTNTAGSIRYNSSGKVMEYCNGTIWDELCK